jgi:hypothetical protein
VTTHLICREEPWGVELRVVRTADDICVGHLQSSVTPARPEETLPHLPQGCGPPRRPTRRPAAPIQQVLRTADGPELRALSVKTRTAPRGALQRHGWRRRELPPW